MRGRAAPFHPRICRVAPPEKCISFSPGVASVTRRWRPYQLGDHSGGVTVCVPDCLQLTHVPVLRPYFFFGAAGAGWGGGAVSGVGGKFAFCQHHVCIGSVFQLLNVGLRFWELGKCFKLDYCCIQNSKFALSCEVHDGQNRNASQLQSKCSQPDV